MCGRRNRLDKIKNSLGCEKMLDKRENRGKISFVRTDAGVAHPVERHLAKVEVASSSLVARSKKRTCRSKSFFVSQNEYGYKKPLLPDETKEVSFIGRSGET